MANTEDMEKLEKSSSNSSSETGDRWRSEAQETKQERLERYRMAALHNADVGEEEEPRPKTAYPVDTRQGQPQSATGDDGQEPHFDGFRWPAAGEGHGSTTEKSDASSRDGAPYANMPQLYRERTKLANKKSHPLEHIGITLGLPMIALCDLIIPCIIYYTWYLKHRSSWQQDCKDWHDRGAACPIEKEQFNEKILGYAVVCFGFGELYVLLARVWRLFFRREQCAPLLSRNRWELDATSWVYLVAMLIALIPFVVGASLVIPKLYLYGPAFLMAFLGILMVITTLHPFNIPIGINSHERGSGLRPFIYYAAEDFIAVDGLQDREFRVRYNERYETSKAFRQMFVMLTLWWELGVLIYIGCLSAVIWTLDFHIAFGLSLGLLFGWIVTWAITTVLFVNWEMDRQRKAYEAGKDGV